MANDVENTSSKVYRLLSDRCSLRVESAANPLRCCLSWRRACEVRRGGPAGRVRGHRMTGGTPKEVHWTAEQQKRPQRTYRGRKRRETAAKGSTTGRCFRPQNVVFVNPPKDSPEYGCKNFFSSALCLNLFSYFHLITKNLGSPKKPQSLTRQTG